MTILELEQFLINRFGDVRVELRELSQYLRINEKTLRNGLANGTYEIRTYKEGQRRWCDVRDLASYLDQKRKKAT